MPNIFVGADFWKYLQNMPLIVRRSITSGRGQDGSRLQPFFKEIADFLRPTTPPSELQTLVDIESQAANIDTVRGPLPSAMSSVFQLDGSERRGRARGLV